MESRNYGYFTLTGARESNKTRKITYYFIDDSEITDGVLIEILLRLPLKTIFKFKRVSKRWLSIISDPSFATSFMARVNNKKVSPPWDLLYLYQYDVFGEIPAKDMVPRLTFKHHPEFNSPNFSLQFLTRQVREREDQSIRVLEASNGLLLCCKTLHWQADYYVCNPLTTQWVSLPKPPVIHKWVNVGFTSKHTSYKVVRIVAFFEWTIVLNLEIFSSDIGQWRDLKVSCPQYVGTCMSFRRAVFLNEIMHYISAPRAVIAIDPNKNDFDQCRLISLPEDGECQLLGMLGICCSHLCYLHTDTVTTEPFRNWCVRVWVLKDYDSGEWSIRCKTPFIDITSLDRCHSRTLSRGRFHLMPIAFHPFDTDTVYLSSGYYIASYNLRTKRMKRITDRLLLKGFVNYAVVFPFVLPPWPTLIPQPTWN